MDPVILTEKLEALRRCLSRIEQKRATSAEELARELDSQDILSLNLTRAVQLCVDMATHVLSDTQQPTPQTMGEAFALLAEEGIIPDSLSSRMQAAVGFRNIAVHNYRNIDWAIVHAITTLGLDDFHAFATSMTRLIERT